MRHTRLVISIAALLVASLACADDVRITGKSDERLASFDRLLVRIITEHKLPGASLAIGRNGKLICSGGEQPQRFAELMELEFQKFERVISPNIPRP